MLRCLFTIILGFGTLLHAQVERVWLSHQYHEPSRLVINWETSTDQSSQVRYGPTRDLEFSQQIEGQRKRHHLDISIPAKDQTWYYQVGSGEHLSEIYSFKTAPTETLKILVVANLAFSQAPKEEVFLAEQANVLMTAGDNVPRLHIKTALGTKAYSQLIDRFPNFFASVPFMPALGNHDHEIAPRTSAPPAQPVYDLQAQAFREFFSLPAEESIWHFDYPEFGMRIAALDLHHLKDQHTTWQSSPDCDENGHQYQWYSNLLRASKDFPHVVTLMNESMRNVERHGSKKWKNWFMQNSLLISGCHYNSEHAIIDQKLNHFNTSIPYKAPKTTLPGSIKQLAGGHYMVLSMQRGNPKVLVQYKDLEGRIAYETEVDPRH